MKAFLGRRAVFTLSEYCESWVEAYKAQRCFLCIAYSVAKWKNFFFHFWLLFIKLTFKYTGCAPPAIVLE